jgi:S1-C subfamily serine protease
MEVNWEQLAHSVVYIEANCDGYLFSGSGTIVLDGEHVLTNHHVVTGESGGFCDLTVFGMESLKDDLVFLAYGEVIPQALDYGLDLAVIRLVDTNGRPVKAAGRTPVEVIERELLLGEEMKVAGFPAMGGDTFTLTPGEISGWWSDEEYVYWDAEFEFYKVSAKMGPGVSGGAAFDAETGEFVGVPTGTPSEEDTGDVLGLVRPAKYAIQLLDAAERVD